MHASNEIIYNGKRMLKNHFRAFVYGADNQKKVVNSWDEYEKHVETGIWFSKKNLVPIKKKQRTRKIPIHTDSLPSHEGE